MSTEYPLVGVSGAATINLILGQKMDWKEMLCEWIDNSLGAGATRITIRRTGPKLEIIDNGHGCDNLIQMESLGESVKKPGNKASMYGYGGVMGQIKASDCGLVEVVSTTETKTSEIAMHWGECRVQNVLRPRRFVEANHPRRARTGTTITIHKCKRMRDTATLARELGYRYSGVLRQGAAIVMEIDGRKQRIRPYEHPPFARTIAFAFDLDGCHITVEGGIVEPGEPNPYPGFSILWGYRFIGQFQQPAEGRPMNRVFFVVHLPESWRNINPTKDNFSDEPDDLWEILAERCREIIEAADAEGQEIELKTSCRDAEAIMGIALGDRPRISLHPALHLFSPALIN